MCLTATPYSNWQFSAWSSSAPANGCLTVNGNASLTANFVLAPAFFVDQLYLDLLGHPADPNGFAYWLELLNAGPRSRAQVAYQFFTDPQFQQDAHLVVSAYIGVLGRDPDFAGWQYWTSQMHEGLAPLSVIADFVQSTEFQNTYGGLNNSGFVSLVYLNLLGRAADAGGLQYWTSLLTSGAITRAGLMYEFLVSTEFQRHTQNRASVILMYLGLLRRAPESSGESYWTAELNAGVSPITALSGFLASPAYLARFAQ